jgi:hypothetical protein
LETRSLFLVLAGCAGQRDSGEEGGAHQDEKGSESDAGGQMRLCIFLHGFGAMIGRVETRIAPIDSKKANAMAARWRNLTN